MWRNVKWLFAGALAVTVMVQPVQAELEFGIPEPVPFPFNGAGGYGYPWFSDDQLEMYFSTDRPGPNSSDPYIPGGYDIWTSHRESVTDPWQPLVNFGAPVNTPEWAEFGPSFTGDGEEFYFVRALSPFGLAEGDLFVSYRQPDDSWGEPLPLEGLNTAGIESYPSISRDGLTLYFNTLANENYPNPAGLALNMYVASRASRDVPFTEAEFFFGGYGLVTPDGLTHIISGTPAFADFYGVPNVGNGDLYIRTRDNIDEDFGPVQYLKPPVSSSGQLSEAPFSKGLECCGTSLSASGSTLYFTSIRPGTNADGPLGFVDMWQVEVAEAVPLDVEPGGDSEPINWLTETVLPAAILSTEMFNALDVDVTTLLFGDPLLIGDGALPVSPTSSALDDVNGDGLTDLRFDLSIPDLLANGVIGLATEEGYFAAQTFAGAQVAGRDGLTFIPEPGGMLLLLAGVMILAISKRLS